MDWNSGRAHAAYSLVPAGTRFRADVSANSICVLTFLDSGAALTVGGKRHEAAQYTVYIPVAGSAFEFTTREHQVACLRVDLDLSAEDLQELSDHPDRLPFLRLYDDCPKYRQDVKTAKTVSRSVVPIEIVPRFCMGSVETTGPDQISPHRHDELEQIFYGLEGNLCELAIGAARREFRQGELVHIPLGVEHSVRAREGQVVNYLWMDFFLDSKGIETIRKEHVFDVDE